MALKKNQIIEQALVLLNENGLEGVTLRKLAKRLDVQAPALYWHFKNKAVLVNEMAEAILLETFADEKFSQKRRSWRETVTSIFDRLRKALLAYTDGGRVVAGAHLSLTMAGISEKTITTLLKAGLSLRDARLITLTATHYTFGFVIEEQTPPPKEGLQEFDMNHFKSTHPNMVKGIEEYFAPGRTVDDLFHDGLKLVVGVDS